MPGSLTEKQEIVCMRVIALLAMFLGGVFLFCSFQLIQVAPWCGLSPHSLFWLSAPASTNQKPHCVPGSASNTTSMSARPRVYIHRSLTEGASYKLIAISCTSKVSCGVVAANRSGMCSATHKEVSITSKLKCELLKVLFELECSGFKLISYISFHTFVTQRVDSLKGNDTHLNEKVKGGELSERIPDNLVQLFTSNHRAS